MLWVVVATLFCSHTALASDYYFRPTNIAHVQIWTPDLEFQVSNPGDSPVLLTLAVKPSGIMPANFADEICCLVVLPAQILLMPGSHKRVKLRYDSIEAVEKDNNFEILVKQEPIFFATPGSVERPDLMTVTNYTAEVSVRKNHLAKRLLALASKSSKLRAEFYP